MKILLMLLLAILLTINLEAQFDVKAYEDFLKEHQDMPAQQLLDEYPAGLFERYAKTDFLKADFADSIISKYKLTDYEKSLLNDHSFMATERLSYPNMMQAFYDVYHKDLPVYISSDAVLYTAHYSFDKILSDIEQNALFFLIKNTIDSLSQLTGKLAGEYSNSMFQTSVKDFDIYITVAKNLLKIDNASVDYQSKAYFRENDEKIGLILDYIKSGSCSEISLFSDARRKMDFSQFTLRGHYTKDDYYLSKYFRAMTWLGRTDIYLTDPGHQMPDPSYKQSEGDLLRQSILTALLAEALVKANITRNLVIADSILTALIGTQDNITVFDVIKVMKDNNINFAGQLLDTGTYNTFRNELFRLNSSKQLYNSQILFSDPDNPVQVTPPSVFLLMGQRPVIDGYITSRVTYDNILYADTTGGNKKIKRMLPSSQDVLFALGNDASAQLLESELNHYKYADNLASLRYLITGYDSSVWNMSCYTSWLSSIRSLNPPLDRTHMPEFMKTAAWWQKTMNTQLSGWAQLRHDFLLYAKQPYTGSFLCSYPYGYVEPVPEFYKNMKRIFSCMEPALKYLDESREGDFNLSDTISRYINRWSGAMDTLSSISVKELGNEELDQSEYKFIRSAIFEEIVEHNCMNALKGWYLNLYYGLNQADIWSNDHSKACSGTLGFNLTDYTIADVHTAPYDENGNETGFVMHAGTGPVNMCVVAATDREGTTRAYIGPVMSYYEIITDNYKRLTDEEWLKVYDYSPSARPQFTNLYLAGKDGGSKGRKLSLFVNNASGVNESAHEPVFQVKAFPNPANDLVMISFSIPLTLDCHELSVAIYDNQGRCVRRLINRNMPGGNYVMRWDGKNDQGLSVPPGSYFIEINSGSITETVKALLVR